MRRYNVKRLAAAGALAALAVALTMLYVSSAGAKAKDSRKLATIYVAARDVAPGTLGADVRLRAERVLRSSVAPGAVVRPDALRGLVAAAPIYRGEQVTTRRFAPLRAQGVLADLRGTLRALQIAGEPEQLLAGTLRAGDRVDVAAVLKDSAGRPTGGRIVLRNLLVLRAPDASSDSGVGAGGPGQPQASAMLRLSDRQARLLFWITKTADWSLVLRPVLRPADSS